MNQRATEGFFVKTLRILNRDPSSVIFLDVKHNLTEVNPLSVSKHPENAFIVPTLSHGNKRKEGYLRNLIAPLVKLSLLASPVPVQKNLESIMNNLAADSRLDEVPMETDQAYRRNIYRLHEFTQTSLEEKNPFLKYSRKVPEGSGKKSKFGPKAAGSETQEKSTSGFTQMASKAKSSGKPVKLKKPIDYNSIGQGTGSAKLFADAHLLSIEEQNNQIVPATPLSRNAKKELEKDLTRVLEVHNDPQRIKEERSTLHHELSLEINRKFKGKF
jgi:hypothetical protein